MPKPQQKTSFNQKYRDVVGGFIVMRGGVMMQMTKKRRHNTLIPGGRPHLFSTYDTAKRAADRTLLMERWALGQLTKAYKPEPFSIVSVLKRVKIA